MQGKILIVRLPDDLAARLEDRRRRTLVPTSVFVRQAIEAALCGKVEKSEEGQPAATARLLPVSTSTNGFRERQLAAEAIYELYPRKVGRLKALQAIMSAIKRLEASPLPLEEAVGKIAEATALFAKSTAGSRGQLTPHPSTWFNRESYLDDPKEWNAVGIETRIEKPKSMPIADAYEIHLAQQAEWEQEEAKRHVKTKETK